MHQRLMRAQAPGRQAFTGHGRSQGMCRTHRPLHSVTRQVSCQQRSHGNAHSAALTAKTVRDHAVNLFLSLSLAAVCCLQQPLPAVADTSTMPPPTASSSSAASSAATRTVVDVVSGENSVLNEENTPDNRDSPDRKSEENKNPVADTSEVSSFSALTLSFLTSADLTVNQRIATAGHTWHTCQGSLCAVTTSAHSAFYANVLAVAVSCVACICRRQTAQPTVSRYT